MPNTNLTDYLQFITSVTSEESMDLEKLIESYKNLKKAGCDISRLDTAATGLASESGELLDIIKKLKFQGKPWDNNVREAIIKEAGDVMFYFGTLCNAMNVDPLDVIKGNVDKLSSRYPGGFSVWLSENRKEGDV